MDTKNSISTFLLALWKNKLFVFIVGVLGLLLPMTPPFFLGVGQYWDNYKYILMALTPLLGFGVLFFQGNSPLKLSKADLGWGLFLLIAFASYTWATNGSLIWYLSFIWLGMILWMLLMRNIVAQPVSEAYLHGFLVLIFLAILLHVSVVYFDNQLIKLERWNSHFGYNSNYSSLYLLAFFPFLLFFDTKNYFLLALKAFAAYMVLLILYKAQAKGAALAFLLLFGYTLKCILAPKYFKWLFISGLLGTIVFIGVYADTILEFFNKLISGGTEIGNSHRIYMIKSTLNMVAEKPILGQGLGNWYLQAYRTDLTNVTGFNQALYYIRLGSHNLYEQLLSEIGIIGFAAFLFPIIMIAKRGLLQTESLTYLEKAAFASLLVYLGGSFFYKDANGYEAHFSSLQLLAFVNIGILTANVKNSKIFSKWFKLLVAGLAIPIFIWFIYFHKVDLKYKSIVPYFNWWYGVELMDIFMDKSIYKTDYYRDEEKLKQILEDIYHPIFKTTHGFYAGRRGPNQSLELHLATMYLQQKDYTKAENFYKKALTKAPYDEELLRKYVRFLLHIKGDVKKAKQLTDRVYNIQSNNLNNCALMAEMEIYLKNYEVAKELLVCLNSNRKQGGYMQQQQFLLAKIAVEQRNFKEAEKHFNYFKMLRNNYYADEIIILKQQLEQATKNAVKE